MKTCLLVPCMNEIDGLKEIVPNVNPDWYDRLIILDGGSTDGSVEFATAQGWEIITQTRRGMRMAYMESYPHITEDIVVTFSPDGNSVLDAIPLLTARIKEGYDMVIASRYKDDAKSDDDTALTGVANWCFTKIISLFGYPYTDAMVMFRAYRREVPEKLKLNVERSAWYEKHMGRYVSWEPLMSMRAAKAGLRLEEIPSDEPIRIDETGQGTLLPTTRISHFKAGLACGLQWLEEMVFWKF